MVKVYPIVIVLLLAGVTAHYFFGPKEVFIRHNCLIQKTGNCTIEQSGVALSLTLNPNPIIPTEDVTYELKTSGVDVESVTLRVLGHDMEMPRDEQVFPLKSFLKDNEFQATRTFPTCTEKLMTWRLYLVIKGKNKWVRTTFDLEVARKS
jgi:hypothetical protein